MLVGFILFTREYHSSQYQRQARKTFVNGLVSAVDYARHSGDHPICVTGEVLAPYIFVLFNEQMNPAEYLGDIRYLNMQDEFRKMISMGRYTFGLENCPQESNIIYILSGGKPPNPDINYKVKKLLDFQVYIPK